MLILQQGVLVLTGPTSSSSLPAAFSGRVSAAAPPPNRIGFQPDSMCTIMIGQAEIPPGPVSWQIPQGYGTTATKCFVGQCVEIDDCGPWHWTL